MHASTVDAPLAYYQNSVVFLPPVIVVACEEIALAFLRNAFVEDAEKVDSLVAGGDAAAASQGKELSDARAPSVEEASEAQSHHQGVAAGSSDRWGTSS